MDSIEDISKRDSVYQLLRESKVDEANALIASGEPFDFTRADFRSLNLQGLKVEGLDFSGSYFRATDLRGLDMRSCCLEGASLHDALVSGVYFPDQLSPEEIRLSIEQGTRMRYS